jgi:hypothetical protein
MRRIDPIRHQGYGTVCATACRQRRGADHHFLRSLQCDRVETLQPGDLASGSRCQQPVVSDVVERWPTWTGDEWRVGDVVKPQQRPGESDPCRGINDTLAQPAVSAGTKSARQRF